MKEAHRILLANELERIYAAKPETVLLDKKVRARYERLKAALDLSFTGVKSGTIKKELGVSRQELYYYRNRFFTRRPDGQIEGYRVLLKGARVNPYTREMPSTNTNPGTQNDWGYAGSLNQCLRDHPVVQKRLNARLKGKDPDKIPAAGLNIQAIHKDWIEDLRAAGIGPSQWPFCVKSLGYASLASYVKNFIGLSHSARLRKYGKSALDIKDGLSGKTSWLRSFFVWDIACYDEQVFPAFGTITFELDGVEHTVPADRCSLCLLTLEGARAILSYHLSYRRRVATSDFLKTFSRFLTPWKPKVFTAVPTLKYKKGAGFPSMIPGFLRSIRIAYLKIDNDLTHYANAILVYLRQKLGIHVQFGQPGRWITRIAVEQIFSELQVHFGQLASTTGSGPKDPRTNNPVAAAMKFDIRMDELLEVVDVVLANFNGVPREELKGATPLEVLSRRCARADEVGSAVPGLNPNTLEDLPLPVNVVRVQIVGNIEKSVYPHVQMDGVSYTSDQLRHQWSLCGTPATAHLHEDHRLMHLYTLDGRGIGTVEASGHWALSPHDRQTRKAIQMLRKEGALTYGRTDDPVAEYRAHLAQKMANRARSHPNKVAKEANVLLRLGQIDSGAGGMRATSVQRKIPGAPPKSRGAVWRAGRRNPGGQSEN